MPPKEKKGKKSANADDSGEAVILQYMKSQNRPYSANDVFNNLHGAVGKTNVVKALAALADSNQLTAKTYNKAIVYVVNQDENEAPSPETLDEMDRELDTLKNEVAQLKDDNKLHIDRLKELNSSLTNEQLEQKIKSVDEELREMNARLEILRSGSVLITPEERMKIDQEYDTNRKHWRVRRKMCKEVLNAIMEHCPTSPSETLAEIGIETDEDAGVDINKDPLAEF